MEPRVLQYESIGEGAPLVLLPGGLTGWLSWIPFAERLATRRRPIRVQPIHNELGSAGLRGEPGYSYETERESLRLTLDELGLERADFAGWSGGGRALIEFTLEYPERVRTATLVEPAAYSFLDDDDPDVERVNEFVDGLAGKEVTEDDLAQFLHLAGFVTSVEDARDHPNWSGWLGHRTTLSWQPRQLSYLPRSVDELEGISCPVLVVKGSRTAPWLSRVADVLAERIPQAQLLELPGDHACHIQSMDAFLEGLEEHLR
jgi:pimeloyl-ACP methyl ester carboxylesterase